MAFNNNNYDQDSTTGTCTLPQPSPSWQNDHNQSIFAQDRLRLGRELVRNFDDSFPSIAPPGDDNTTFASAASFDVGKDANATSTKRISPIFPQRRPPPGTMLYQTPTIDSRFMRENFIDFTMAADDITDSYELARGRNHLPPGVSFMDQTTDVFSIGAPSPRGGNDGRRRSTGRKDDKRRNRNSSEEAGDLGAGRIPRKTRVQPHDRSLGSPMPRISSFADLNFDEATSTPKRGKSRISNGSGDRPAKITDHVSSTGSGGSRASRLVNPTITPRDRDSEEDALSDLGNTGRQWFGNTRFQHSVPARGRRLSEDLTGDVPAIVARQRKPQAEAIPKGFKSTNDFLKELGLDGHTQTINLQNSLKELKDVGTPVRIRPRNTPQNPARNLNLDPSFMIPHMADMTDLFSGNEVTRFSAKKGAAAKSHVPIGSIPIPHETRAMLTAMKLLQEKVANLEGDKVTTEQKCSKLEAELRRAELKYQQETRRARLSEEELRRRGRTAFPVSDNEDMERTRTDFIMEKMDLESTISSLQGDIKQLQHELKSAKIALQNMQEERNAAINSVAMAISSNEDLKAANIDLYNQLELMGHEKRQAERRITHQRDEYQAREEILRQRAREAKHATAIAEQAMKEAARRDSEAQEAAEREAAARRREQLEMERQEMERVVKERAEEEREEQRRLEIKWEFDRCVEEELRKIRPDLFVGRTEPFTVPSATATKTRTVEVDGRKRVIALPKSRRSRRPPPGESSEAEIVPEQKGKGKAQQPKSLKHATATAAGPDDSTYSISPEEIRRIAQEINAERKKRKAAVAAEKARQGTERKQTEQATTTHPETETVEPKKTKGRKVVKAVYLMEGDTTEIRQLEQEIQSGAAASETANRTIQEIVVEEEAEHEKGQETTALVEVESAAQPDTAPRATPQAPSVDVQFDHASLENHDPRQCTVCVRYEAIRLREEEQERENPLKDIDNSCLLPAPELDPVSKRSRGEGPYEEESTDRPSVDPKTQLERVVRQLRDEFKHLKLIYQQKSEEFVGLDPSVQKKKRKALTHEMNDIVSEMDAKSDQIYALYDVNEEFVDRGRRPLQQECEMGDETEDLIRSLAV